VRGIRVRRLKELVSVLEQIKDLLPSYGWFPSPGDSPRWWAGYSDPFHIVITAVLVQMTRWSVAEGVFRRLLDLGLGTPSALASVDVNILEELLKPVNYRRSKARALIEISRLLLELDLNREPLEEARKVLLKIKGVGRETTDSILLFAYNKPTIPISRQLRRVLERYGINTPRGYEEARKWVVEELNQDLYKLKLLHATTTIIAREFCKIKTTKCSECPLTSTCSKNNLPEPREI